MSGCMLPMNQNVAGPLPPDYKSGGSGPLVRERGGGIFIHWWRAAAHVDS